MTSNHPETGRPRSGPRTMLVAACLVLGTTMTAACTPHTVAQKHPCPDLSLRGAVALAKLGLTPKELKAQEHCG